MDGSVDFYRKWNDYATGFGSLIGEFWLGEITFVKYEVQVIMIELQRPLLATMIMI